MSMGGVDRRRGQTGVSRREFLQVSGLAAAGLATLSGGAALGGSSNDRAVILLMLVGGPSQLETFDPKPDAPAEVRGPSGSIATTVPGVRLGEGLPGLARRMDRLTLIRSLHHDAAPIHETGQQLLQTGRLARTDREWPHVGAAAAWLLGPRGSAPPFALLPGPIGHTGVAVSHGQGGGFLGDSFGPARVGVDGPIDEPARVREAYGPTPFGRSCLGARRLVEAGARVVVVNMYPTVFGRPTWDCHGRAPFATLTDVRDQVLPEFDRVFSALLDDLDRLGRLGSTLVLATGEFGRTPRLNRSGGRDHWPGVWSAVLAGGGMPGGRVLGASDRLASEPADRPVSPAELTATLYRFLGLDPSREVPTHGGEPVPLDADARPLAECPA
jgi:hypothetical protein